MATRKLKPRPSVPLPDTYFVTPDDVRKFLGLSHFSFEKRFRWYLWDFPQPVQLGNSIDDLRFRLDEIPNSGYQGTWLNRFKTRQAIDFAAPTKQIARGVTA
jgi:hypothetical protein